MIIARFRAKLQTIAKYAKPDSKTQDEKTAQTVCLLSAVLLLPYLSRGHASILVGGMGLVYSSLVLPMVISANYKYPLNGVKECLLQLVEHGRVIGGPLWSFFKCLYSPMWRTENAFLKMNNIATMANQVVFFLLCDHVLVPGQRVTCLYTLMFYNVIAYCISYIKELIEKEDWSPYVQMTDHSQLKHLAMSATKFVLEWTKAVTFIITVVFMLLVFGLESGLENYKPSTNYAVVTWIYYMLTEKVFVDLFPAFLSFIQLDILESLETLWAPVILRATTLVMSIIFTIPLIVWGQYRLGFLSIYHNIYLRGKELAMNSLKILNVERAVIGKFRYATEDELEEFDDVCAVCLCPMRLSRITPCHHMFHGECLRQCLKTSDKCPICKRELIWY